MLIPTEHEEQAAFIEWCAWNKGKFPELHMLFAVPNERKAVQMRVKLKKEGVKPGVPDLFLDVARGGYFGLRMETKRTKGGKVSDSQYEWIQNLSNQGYLAKVCYGYDELVACVEHYLTMPKTEVKNELN